MIRAALVGVGSCASSLVQAIHLSPREPGHHRRRPPGFRRHRITDISVAAAFDVDRRKIGQDLADAIFAEPNRATWFTDVPPTGVVVTAGPLADGVSRALESMVHVDATHDATTADVVAEGSSGATRRSWSSTCPSAPPRLPGGMRRRRWTAGCALVNCTPAPLATDPQWAEQFAEHGLPLLGDDVKSQFGSTAFHRALLGLIRQRGGSVESSYQLNAGGNTDFLNMRQPDVAVHKRRTKRASLTDFDIDPDALSVGPSDYIAHLQDRKVGYINIVGRGLMGARFSIEMKLEVEDSPNSAGVVVDAVRAARVALDRGLAGPIGEPSAALFKNPPEPLSDVEALAALDRWAADGGAS